MRHAKFSRLPAVLFGCIAAGAAEPAPQRHDFLASVRHLEFVEMLSAIVTGEEIGPGAGWFHPSQSLYSWKSLAERMDADHDGAITPEEFTGPRELFDRLDRDGDGRLTAADFDWSEASPYWRQAGMAKQLLRRADADKDGKLSEKEWQSLFQQAAKGKDKLTADDLRLLLFPPQPKRPPGPPPGMPSKATLLLGLFQSEIGSPSAGPAVGATGPRLHAVHAGRQANLDASRFGPASRWCWSSAASPEAPIGPSLGPSKI